MKQMSRMKVNLSTLPDSLGLNEFDLIEAYGKWLEDFEAELREDKDILERLLKKHGQHANPYIKGMWKGQLKKVKEILDE